MNTVTPIHIADLGMIENSSLIEEASPNSGELSSSSAVYTNYENLTNPYGNYMDFGVVFSALLSNSEIKHNWRIHFELIEHLRMLNKFHYFELNLRIKAFTSFIIQSIDNLRSNISKDALLFLKEVIPSSKFKELPAEFLSKIIPVLCDKAISDKSFIRAEAQNVLKLVEVFCVCDSAIVALIEKSFDKNPIICELAFKTLCDLIKQAKSEIQFKLTLGACKKLFKAIIKAIDGKRAIMKKGAEDLWLHLRQILEKECDIESFLKMKIGLSEKDVQMLMKITAEKKKVIGRPNLQSFLKERKMMVEEDLNLQKFKIQKPELGQYNVLGDVSNRMEIISSNKENRMDRIDEEKQI